MMMKKMKNRRTIDWVKLPVNFVSDDRVAELIAHKGMLGLGVYFRIVLEMYHRPGRCLTVTQLKDFRLKGATMKTVMQVVEEFQLFRKDRYGHVYSMIDFLGFGDDYSCGEDDEPCPEAEESGLEAASDLNPIAIRSESDASPIPARINRDIDKDYRHIDGDGGDTVSPEEMEHIIRQMPKESPWTEAALMKSGFSELILRQWDETLRQFLYHALANCKNQTFCNVGEAMRYFHFYVTNSTTGPQLRKALEEHERTQLATGLYCHEDRGSAPGHRSYHGFPLPDDAPPRPDEQSEWDYEEHCWTCCRHSLEDKYVIQPY